MYRNLDPNKVIDSIDILLRRTLQHFPGSGLSKVCAELLDVSKESHARCEWIAKPRIGLRAGASLAVVLILGLLFAAMHNITITGSQYRLYEFVQILDASMNAVVLIGASIVFLVTVEARVKRTRALKAIHELRALVHVIDMHQATKDPDGIPLGNDRHADGSPKIPLNHAQFERYLGCCSEMLSMTEKLAALYAQNLADAVVLASVAELETLASTLIQKIGQKIMLLHITKPR